METKSRFNHFKLITQNGLDFLCEKINSHIKEVEIPTNLKNIEMTKTIDENEIKFEYTFLIENDNTHTVIVYEKY